MRTKEENEKISVELYSMQLLEFKEIIADKIPFYVTRVPGGWIIMNYNEQAQCFVPYNEEFF